MGLHCFARTSHINSYQEFIHKFMENYEFYMNSWKYTFFSSLGYQGGLACELT